MKIKEEKKLKPSLMDKPVSRRDFSRIAMTFGLTSTLFAWQGFAEAGMKPDANALAETAKEIQKERYRVKPDVKWRYGAAGHSVETTWVAKVGSIHFVRELEERTNGAIRVEHMGSNSICGEMTCMQKTIQGITDFYLSSTQNASTVAIYHNVLDWGALWPSRASLYSFAFDHRSEQLWREPLRRQYSTEMLFGDYGLRGFFMSKRKYGKGKPALKTIESIKGAKIRTTGTAFGRLSMQLMGVNPVPISFEEVVDAVRQGAIDGAEAWEIPFSMIHFTEYTGQYLNLKYCSGNWVTGMNTKSLSKVSTKYQEAVMEAAYLTQCTVLGKEEASIYVKAGAGELEEPTVGSEHWRNNVRNIQWDKEEMEKLERIISPKYNPDPWKDWRKRLNKIYGKGDCFEDIYAIAKEVPAEAFAIDVQPKRWWKPNPPWWKNGVWKRGKGFFAKSLKKKS